MAITFTEFTGKAPRIEAIQVTEENVEELAVWMGSDRYSIEKILVGGKKNVEFAKTRTSEISDRIHLILRTAIGEYIVRIPEGINVGFWDVEARFVSVTQADIDSFVKQQRETGKIDVSAAPYDN